MNITVDTDTLRGLAKIWRRRADALGRPDDDDDLTAGLRAGSVKCTEELEGFLRVLEEDETLP